MIRPLILCGVLLALAPIASAQEREPFDLVAAAERYCISANGNHLLSQTRAVEDGFRAMTPDDIAGVQLPGPQYLRGFTKTVDGVEVRVLTALGRLWGNGQGMNYFRTCWVSATPYEREPVDRELHDILGIDPFRNGNAYVYAWFTRPGGGVHRIDRREMDRTALRDALVNGTQFVMTQDERDMVAITYMVPTETLEDPG